MPEHNHTTEQAPPAWINTMPQPELPEWLDQADDLVLTEDVESYLADQPQVFAASDRFEPIADTPPESDRAPEAAEPADVERQPEVEDPRPDETMQAQEASVEQAALPSQSSAPVHWDQIVIESGRSRSQESVSQAADEPPARNRTERGRSSGVMDLQYSFVHFNRDGDYQLVQRSGTDAIKHPLQSLYRTVTGVEAEYQNKRDNSMITIRPNKITIDNTEGNIQASLDIAQDKGWEVIKISGGSKAAKAEMWYQAQMRGFETIGYEPSEQDKKRLHGAQERQKEAERQQAESLTEALDIRPRQEPEQSPQNARDTQQPESPLSPVQQERGEQAEPRTERKTQKPSAEQTSSTENRVIPDELSPEHLSQAEIFSQAKKEIIGELEKIVPLDEQEYKDLEAAIDKNLTLLIKENKSLNIKELKTDLRNGAPIVRDEFDRSARNEQRHSQDDQQRAANREREHQHAEHTPNRERRGIER